MSSRFKEIDTPIQGLKIIEPVIFGDNRGFFMETYSQRDYAKLGITDEFVQGNHSKSRKGVLRGLHFQTRNTQGKLIRVVAGSVFDVAVDLRPESKTYGKWYGIVLSAENKRQLYVPSRFAHGFLTLEDNTEFLYRCTDYYNPEAEAGIRWDDPEIGIEWNLHEYGITEEELLLAEKDLVLPSLKSINRHKLWE